MYYKNIEYTIAAEKTVQMPNPARGMNVDRGDAEFILKQNKY